MPKPRIAFTPEQIEDRLEEHVDAVLSSRRTAARPAKQLASFDRARQEFVLYWVEAIAKTNSELAYQFADYAVQALNIMDTKSVEAWAIQAMDCYDKNGLSAGIGVLQKMREFAHADKVQRTAEVIAANIRSPAGPGQVAEEASARSRRRH